jgi:hypothetical protein
MKKNILLSLTAIMFLQCGLSQGIIFDTLNYHNLKEYFPEKDQGYAGSYLPERISYRAYCPPVQNQGQVATCVGWATAYAQVSTQQNIMMGETDYRRKSARAMDPNFIYAMIRNYNDGWCQRGTMMSDAMEVLIQFGVKPYISVPWLSCNAVSAIDEFTIALSYIYSITDYYVLQDRTNLTNTLKTTLNNGKVISIGVQTTPSFSKIGSSGLWVTAPGERLVGGHAMCIVGYDDNKFGGSFEVMNSYGQYFGDNGFIWIRYADMQKYMQEAFVVDLMEGTYGFKKGACSFGDCYDHYSRYKYDNGVIFEGQFSKGYIHGFGSFLEPDGTLYIGMFSNGYRDGWGILYDVRSGRYFKTIYKMGRLVSSNLFQGFAGSDEEIKMNELIAAMQIFMPGEVIDPSDDEYEDLMERSEVIEVERLSQN